jgi:antirestriction protein ArdC
LQGRQHIEAYAFEELVAEMGSAFLCGHCGLPASLQHASYVDHWLQALRNDRRLIFTAAALAQKASDYLLAALVQPEAEMALPAPEVA